MYRGLSKAPTRSRTFSTADNTAVGLPGSARTYPSRKSGAGNRGLPPERSTKISHRETAPLLEGPKTSTPRDDGAGCANSSTVTANAPSEPCADLTPALRDREFPRARRHHRRRRSEQHGDIHLAFEQLGGLDGLIIAAIDEHHTGAFNLHPCRLRHRLSGGRDQGAIFGPDELPSADQPALSRTFTNCSGAVRPISSATAENTAVSWVHPTVNGVGSAAAALNCASCATT